MNTTGNLEKPILDTHQSHSMNRSVSSFTLLIPAMLVLVVGGAVTEMYSTRFMFGNIFLLVSYVLTMMYIPRLIIAFDNSMIRQLIFSFFLMLGYVFFRSSHPAQVVEGLGCSIALFVLMMVSLRNGNKLMVFTIFILALLIIVVFSPGITKIYTLSRSFGSHTRESKDVLIGVSGHYINYTIRCMEAFFISVGFCLISKHWLKKAIFAFVALTAFIGCSTAGSRGGIIALFCGIVAFVIMTHKGVCGKRVFRYRYFWPCIVLVLCIFPWHSVHECFMRHYRLTGTLGNRWLLYIKGLEMFREHVLWGNGWGAFRAITTEPQHSEWLRTFVELGLVGAFGECILWLLLFKIALTSRRISEQIGNRKLTFLIIIWTSIMVALCVWQAYENMGLLRGSRLYYICFGVIVSAFLSAKREQRKKQALQL